MMKIIPREEQIQEDIVEKLDKYDIHPFSVICSFIINGGVVSITFYIRQELNEVLNLLGYKSLCDKSGYLILEENNTLILSDLALINLYTLL